jgi:hypothetical protein
VAWVRESGQLFVLDVQSLFKTELRKRLVGKEVDAKFEVRAFEVCGQGRELPDAGDASPAGAVDGGVLTGAVEVHGGDMAVGADGEADEGLALLVERGTGLLGDEGDPVALDVSENSSDVGAEVNALHVGENLDSRPHALISAARSARRVISGAAVVGCVLSSLADGVTRALIRVAEVWARWRRWAGRLDQRLLGWGRSGRRLWSRWSWRGLCRGGGLRRRWSGSFGFAHRPQLLERLLIELLGGAFLGDCLGLWCKPGQILGRVEEGQLLVAFLENVDGTDQTRLVEEHTRTVEQEPDDPQINDDGDVDGLAEACFGAFVVKRIEQMDQLVLFEFAVTAGPHLDGLGRRRGVWRYL